MDITPSCFYRLKDIAYYFLLIHMRLIILIKYQGLALNNLTLIPKTRIIQTMATQNQAGGKTQKFIPAHSSNNTANILNR